MGSGAHLAFGPVDVLGFGRLLRDGADSITHGRILDGEEAYFGLGKPTVLVVVSEVDRMSGDFVRLKVVEKTAGIIEVQDIPRCRLNLRSEPGVTDVHFAVPANLAIPHYWHSTFRKRHLIEPDERDNDRDDCDRQ
jgi:hypothetical protein